MNRSRYVPQQQAYAVNPYQAFGPMPTSAQPMPGMMPIGAFPPQQSAFGAGSPNPNPMGASPILQQHQHLTSPASMWANFANGPIIEDLCAPPPTHMGLAGSPPMNALPHHHQMRLASMGAGIHPSSLPQIQNVYGMRHPGQPGGTPHPGFIGAFPGSPPGMPVRMAGSFPPGYAAQPQGLAPQWAFQQHQQMQQQQQMQQHHQAQQQRNMVDPNAILSRPRMAGPGMVEATQGLGLDLDMGGQGQQQQMQGGQQGQQGQGQQQPLTPVDNSLGGFLSPIME
ncbi:hypothetical protein QBC35DRAFT_540627 [Podospora australis]|uniref:Uncharacterized protein n=1 Tax=Podospora australis TaxID=1536484 RepID=A0AAN6WQ09_9PEZI|nr:hypothetical protein QBC35DRAFT_540627 [Podospora australis]